MPSNPVRSLVGASQAMQNCSINILQTYFVTLPSTVRNVTAYLHDHYRIERLEVTLDPSLLSPAVEESGRANISAVVPQIREEKALVALKELRSFLAQIKHEGAE